MKLVRCPNCGFVCKRNGKTNAVSQRWYVCRYEHSKAWEALLRRISSLTVVISDGGTGFQNA